MMHPKTSKNQAFGWLVKISSSVEKTKEQVEPCSAINCQIRPMIMILGRTGSAERSFAELIKD
jgi:hypothetical protein